MTSTLEDLPDEILLIICRYLPQNSIIYAFFDLNTRLNCTISRFTRSLIIKSVNNRSLNLLSIIAPYLHSLTLNDVRLSPSAMSLAVNVQELTFIRAHTAQIPPLDQLISVNIYAGPDYDSIDILFSHPNTLRYVYIASTSSFTIPIFSPSKISMLEYLTLSLQSSNDLLRLLIICPMLIYLHVNLQKIDEQHILSDSSGTTKLREFHLRTTSTINLSFLQLKTIFKYVNPSTLEHLGVEIYTTDASCVDGQLWEDYLVNCFPQLKQFDFFVLLRSEISESVKIRLANVLPKFRSSFWEWLLPHKMTGYYNNRMYQPRELCIHTEQGPQRRRRRYCPV